MSDQKQLQDFPDVLINVVKAYEASGSILCVSSPTQIAEMWRSSFRLPTPIGMNEASCFVQNLEGIRVYLQPRLEASTRFSIRGIWVGFRDNWFVFIDAERPNPSQIRTLIHELSEKALHISHLLHPNIPERTGRKREEWANKVASCVKMPPDEFCQQVSRVQLDVEVLKRENDETLACVARHIRDWVMRDRPYYYCRFDIAPWGLSKNKYLAQIAKQLDGQCIRMVDVTHSELIDFDRRKEGGALPNYNLPASDHYRILSPVMNRYIQANRAVFFEGLQGGASESHYYRDLFGEHELCTLLVPYGLRQTRGFWMIALHPSDRFRLEPILSRIQPEERGSIDWLFSWYYYTHKRQVDAPAQKELAGLGDTPPALEGLFSAQFEREPYLWPKPQSDLAA